MEEYKDLYKGKIGVILTNLGTPNAPSKKALKKYLNQFLMDKRVVDLNRLIWIPILKLIILSVRPKKSAKLYKKIWTKDGSPLMVFMNNIKRSITERFSSSKDDFQFEIAMRYGDPSFKKALNKFKDNYITKILVLPLYPQAGSPTTSSSMDEVFNELKDWPWVPSLRFISGYHDHEKYISALSASVEKHFVEHGKPEKLLLSFHGMPQRYLEEGDPYYCFCHKTARLVAEKLELNKEDYELCFQSRFGREPWLKPYTDDVIEDCVKDGIKKIAVISPGFSVDCLETLEEIEIQYKELFLELGGTDFAYIPCLNDSNDHISLIADLIDSETKGWQDV
tara:strand:- start:5958 stop:6968 length:1011 start_codon:yes stop_codon:yes gene_type:complete